MRKAQKKQVELLEELLGDEQGKIKDALELQDYVSAAGLLEHSQQCAIQIGEIVESAKGEDLKTIHLLEEYCEHVYQIYKAVESGENVKAGKMQEGLQILLENIKQSIADNIKIHFEIAFLPFKASAWDSMDNLWKAAKADPDYEVYVIPIPYYYKAWDGSFQKKCYEAEAFPKDLPVIGYDVFDFEEHHPDVIVIHNPYDNGNPTTSVHPFFYSDNLKKYTDKLVYTPWFLLDELEQEDQAALENMNYYVMMPGVINADKVIVQSETMRRTYVDFLTRKAGGNSRSIWEEKICTYDLCKSNTAKGGERKNMPAEWQRKILKPDGSCKKLILCSANISSLLEEGEEFLEKLSDLFTLFQEYKEMVTLVWYSGSVIKENLKGVRPQLWDQYEKLIQVFKNRRWGIYDDSTQEEILAELCDAYYGSGDAVTRFFYRCNKPVWLTNSVKDERTAIKELIKEK